MKKLYKIGYIIEEFNITARTIRYYDELKLLPNIKRSEGGVRLFDTEDMNILEQIVDLKAQGLSLKKIKETINYNQINEPYLIITNSFSYTQSPTDELHVIPCHIHTNQIVQDPKKEHFWSNIYTKNWAWKTELKETMDTLTALDPKTTLYYIYSVNTPKYIQQKILKNLKSIDKKLIEFPINSLGFSSELLINQIGSTLKQKLYHNQLQSIQESIELNHEIIAINSLDYQLTGTKIKKSKTPFGISLENITAIYESSGKKHKLKKACIEEDAVIETLVELCLKEYHQRSHYIRKISINYAYHYRIAHTIFEILSDHINQEKCELIENYKNRNVYFGERFVSIAMI